MTTTAALILSAIATLAPGVAPDASPGAPQGNVVDCEVRGALQRALGKAQQGGDLELRLDGVCRGYFRISGGTVTLRGLTPESGLAAPEGDPLGAPLLEIADANVSLRGMVVRGGTLGVHVHGSDAELLLFEVDVHDQTGLGVWGEDGARVRPLESVFRGAAIGIVIDSATANVQRSTISGRDVGLLVTERSSAAISDSTIEGCGDSGLFVGNRSDVNVLGGSFRDNGSVHVGASDFSTIRLLSGVQLGAPDDETQFSLAATREATIASYSTPQIYGHVSALVGASIRFGNTVLEGDVFASQFANVHARSAEISGSVVCSDGADAYCRQTTTGGAFDCPSSTCGVESTALVSPAIEAPSFERVRRARPTR